MDKTEVKRAYKQTKRPMGVYRIRSSQSDKMFIGFATDLPARFNRHRTELKFGNHRNKDLQQLWNSLGESSFEFEVLDELDHEEGIDTNPGKELRVLAEMWVQKLQATAGTVVFLD